MILFHSGHQKKTKFSLAKTINFKKMIGAIIRTSIKKIFTTIKFSGFLLLILLFISSGMLILESCDFKDSENDSYVYVKPSIDRNGRMRKGYVRKKVSTDKNAMKSQTRSRYYYHTRGKYRKRKK